jgi:hypothetical protein
MPVCAGTAHQAGADPQPPAAAAPARPRQSGQADLLPSHARDGLGGASAGSMEWAARIAGPAYAIDDQTAIKVTDGTVEVVSEGHWKLFAPTP